MTQQRNSESLSNGAVAAVCRDEVSGTHRALATVIPLPRPGGHALAVDLERDELGVVGESGAERLGPRPQNRLERDLGDEQPR